MQANAEMRGWWTLFRALRLEEIYRLIQASGGAHHAFHHFPLEELLAKTEDKHEQLACFVVYWAHLPKQGSAGWLKDKQVDGNDDEHVPTWGGSEADALLGNDKNKDVPKLLTQKLGLESFDGNLYTRWGNLCEEISSTLTEMLLHCRTYETGSIPGLVHEGHVIQKYSPDRLGVVDARHLRPYLEYTQVYRMRGERQHKGEQSQALQSMQAREGPQIVLFEYKNPFLRTPNGEIPRGYQGQIQTGLGTLPFVDLAVFIDLKIRKCRREHFGLNLEYDRGTHEQEFKEITAPPLACGVIGFYRERTAVPAADTVAAEDDQAEQLVRLIRADLLTPGSDYANLRRLARRGALGREHLVAVLALANRYLRVVDVDPEQSNAVVEQVVRQLIPDIAAPDLELIPSFLDALYVLEPEPCEPARVGLDYGALPAEAFDAFLVRLTAERHQTGGLRAFYPKAFYLPELTYYEYPTRGNYIDMTLPEAERAHKWLSNQLRLFGNWCVMHGCEAVGYMPWKNFTRSVVPMPRCDAFMPLYRPVAIEKWELMRRMLRETRRASPEATLAARKAFVEALCPPPSPPKEKTRIERPRLVQHSEATLSLYEQA